MEHLSWMIYNICRFSQVPGDPHAQLFLGPTIVGPRQEEHGDMSLTPWNSWLEPDSSPEIQLETYGVTQRPSKFRIQSWWIGLSSGSIPEEPRSTLGRMMNRWSDLPTYDGRIFVRIAICRLKTKPGPTCQDDLIQERSGRHVIDIRNYHHTLMPRQTNRIIDWCVVWLLDDTLPITRL